MTRRSESGGTPCATEDRVGLGGVKRVALLGLPPTRLQALEDGGVLRVRGGHLGVVLLKQRQDDGPSRNQSLLVGQSDRPAELRGDSSVRRGGVDRSEAF